MNYFIIILHIMSYFIYTSHQTFYILVTNVFCKDSVVSTAQVVANTRVESISYSLCKHPWPRSWRNKHTEIWLMTACEKQPDLLTDKRSVMHSSRKLYSFRHVHLQFTLILATFNDRKIVFVETRNRGELNFILGSTHVLYLEQTRIINLRCTTSASHKEAKKLRLAWLQPHLKANVMKRFIFMNCSSFALC